MRVENAVVRWLVVLEGGNNRNWMWEIGEL